MEAPLLAPPYTRRRIGTGCTASSESWLSCWTFPRSTGTTTPATSCSYSPEGKKEVEDEMTKKWQKQMNVFKSKTKTKSGEKEQNKELLSHHGQASNLSHSQVKSAEVQRFLPDSGQVWDGRPPLLHEGQVPVHPQPPLRLRAHLIQPGDLLVGHPGRVGLLQRPRHRDHRQL